MGNESNVGLCSTNNKCHHFAGPRVFGGVDRQRFTDIPGGRYIVGLGAVGGGTFTFSRASKALKTLSLVSVRSNAR